MLRGKRVIAVGGGKGGVGVANPKFQKKQRLIRELNRLEDEVLLIDLGAGVSYNGLDFFDRPDLRPVAGAQIAQLSSGAYRNEVE